MTWVFVMVLRYMGRGTKNDGSMHIRGALSKSRHLLFPEGGIGCPSEAGRAELSGVELNMPCPNVSRVGSFAIPAVISTNGKIKSRLMRVSEKSGSSTLMNSFDQA